MSDDVSFAEMIDADERVMVSNVLCCIVSSDCRAVSINPVATPAMASTFLNVQVSIAHTELEDVIERSGVVSVIECVAEKRRRVSIPRVTEQSWYPIVFAVGFIPQSVNVRKSLWRCKNDVHVDNVEGNEKTTPLKSVVIATSTSQSSVIEASSETTIVDG
jgi:hypothetical protein